jgi:hypothetical protein
MKGLWSGARAAVLTPSKRSQPFSVLLFRMLTSLFSRVFAQEFQIVQK